MEQIDPPVNAAVPNPVAEAAGAGSKIFISYASQDAAVADNLCAALEASGLPCWIAPRDVRAGESYAAAIVQAINVCKMLALVLSKSASESSHVLREVERASSKKRPVLVVRMDTAELPPDLEYFLSANQWLDASHGSLEQIMPALIASVRSRDAGKVPRPVMDTPTPAAPSTPAPPPTVNKSSSPLSARKWVLALVIVGCALAAMVWWSKRDAAPGSAPIA